MCRLVLDAGVINPAAPWLFWRGNRHQPSIGSGVCVSYFQRLCVTVKGGG